MFITEDNRLPNMAFEKAHSHLAGSIIEPFTLDKYNSLDVKPPLFGSFRFNR